MQQQLALIIILALIGGVILFVLVSVVKDIFRKGDHLLGCFANLSLAGGVLFVLLGLVATAEDGELGGPKIILLGVGCLVVGGVTGYLFDRDKRR